MHMVPRHTHVLFSSKAFLSPNSCARAFIKIKSFLPARSKIYFSTEANSSGCLDDNVQLCLCLLIMNIPRGSCQSPPCSIIGEFVCHLSAEHGMFITFVVPLLLFFWPQDPPSVC